MATHKVLIDGQWRDSNSSGSFQADDPKTASAIAEDYPISTWADCDEALNAAVQAFEELRACDELQIANFLEKFADRIEARSDEICELASRETALPVEPRLASGELPRTTGQLRQAARATRNFSWCQPTIDSATNIRSCLAAIGPVAVFGPNNFPLAFGSISGGDFAAAIAAGNPVIAKANTMHPGTTRLLAEEAQAAADEAGLPPATVQLIYHMDHNDGERLVKDERLAAAGFTGSRQAGLRLKAAADAVGKPIYLELSSVNPVVVLPNTLQQKCDEIATELTGSCLMGTGQFCTNPGLIIFQAGEFADQFAAAVAEKFRTASVGTLLSKRGQEGLGRSVATLEKAGAELLTGGQAGGGAGYSHQNTVLKISGEQFLSNPQVFQTEAFGNATMLVVASSIEQVQQVVQKLEGNLTGCIYSATDGSDDEAYDQVAPALRQKVGRLLNDKMPTGVAVSAAMNHGGPFPATGHPGFTAVGLPGSIMRFSMLQCFDNVRPHRLPVVLRNENSLKAWRQVDGSWTRDSIDG